MRTTRAFAPSFLVVAAACGAASPTEPVPARRPAVARASPAPAEPFAAEAEAPALDDADCAAPNGAALVGLSIDGATVALGTLHGQSVAFVADEDTRAVTTVDLDRARVIGTTRLMGTPRQLLILPDGRLLVAVEDASRVEVLGAASRFDDGLQRLCTRAVGSTPWGLAWDAAGDRATLVGTWPPSLSTLRTDTMKVERAIPLGKAPRSVIVRDGIAYASHLSGSALSVVALDAEQGPVRVDTITTKASPQAAPAVAAVRRAASQGFALASVDLSIRGGNPERRILAPSVSVDPGDATRPSDHYYGDPPGAVPKQAPHVVVIDPGSRKTLSPYVLDVSRNALVDECLLPRAASVRQSTHGLFVACMGIDEVLELDARAGDPMLSVRRRFVVPSGPTGVAVDDARARMVVWSQHDGAALVIDLDGAVPARRIDLDRPEVDATWQAGRRLFFATDDRRITSDGLTCASCHPDGLDDGLTWRTPEGPRQTPMLAGRLAGTQPYGWSREQLTVSEYVDDTTRRLGGHGLPSAPRDALVAYVESLPAPPRGQTWEAEEVGRGRELFEAPGTACQSCHPDGGTDGKAHVLDVARRELFDTPSLASIGRTAPYFHDGRYPSLDAMLADPKSHMGRADLLSREDRRILRVFLESL